VTLGLSVTSCTAAAAAAAGLSRSLEARRWTSDLSSFLDVWRTKPADAGLASAGFAAVVVVVVVVDAVVVAVGGVAAAGGVVNSFSVDESRLGNTADFRAEINRVVLMIIDNR
jgi:hypothetical protein